MKVKNRLYLILIICFIFPPLFCQEKESRRIGILFHGLVLDANTFLPVANSQIIINRAFSSVSTDNGTFAFYVNRNDTVIFNSLGYKPTIFYISDTLTGSEFIAGVYMQTDTLSIGEVIIIPRYTSLKSEIMNARSKSSTKMENARYNVAVSAYQGRNSQSKLDDPASNYEIVRYRQKMDAYERGGIPSDKMIGISPLLLIPAAYLLVHGLPEKSEPLEPQLTDRELDQIQRKYFETLKHRK